jgi:UDP-N-acetylglucosamine diphosphorylase/glucosamine-1-phosphate N-acetyltransferase
MQAIILAAGEGTRMRPLTATVPKPMLPVADRPLAAHTADAAVDAGADRLVFVVGYESAAVREFFGDEYRDVPVAYAVQEEQLGTAHAALAASEHIDGDFAVLNGDNLYDTACIERLFADAPAVVARAVPNPANYGVLSTHGGRVTGIVEKPADPPTNLANAGGYAFPAEAREWLDVEKSERGEYEITDVLARVIEAYDVTPVEADHWLDVGRPWELLAANEWKIAELERRIDGEVRGDAALHGTVVVEEGAVIKPGVVIEGPAIVRSGATVGPNAYIRGATLIGENCHIGHAVELKNTIVMDDSNVPHLSYVGDSLLGTNVNFGAGTQVANLRHDGQDIKITVKGERLSTGRRKFGVVAGPGTKTGVNSSLDPGVVLSQDARVLPGERVSRDR